MARWGDKVGNYIHLHYKNYLRYGLAPRGNTDAGGQGNRYSITKYVDQLKQEIKAMNFSQVDVKEFEQILNTIFSKRNLEYSKEAQDIQQEVIEYLQTIVHNITVDDIDWETFTVKPRAAKKLSKNVDLSKASLSASTLTGSQRGKGNKVRLSALTKQFQEIARLASTIENQTTFSKLKKDFKAINAVYQQIKAQNIKMIDSQDLKNLAVLQVGVGKNKRSLNLIESLNYLGREVIKSEHLSAFEGTMAEVIIASIYKQVAGISEATIADLLGDLDKSTNVIDPSNFSSKLNFSNILSDSWKYNDKTGQWVLTTPAKGKIDIYGSVNSLDEAGMSVKSYNLNTNSKIKDIKLVSETNLFYLLQNRAQFFNHYLNQTVASKDGNNNSVGPPSAIIKNANETLKRMLILLSFVGGGLRTSVRQNEIFAKIFIVNDKATGAKKILDIGELARKIVSTSNFLSQFQVDGIDNDTTWLNKYIPNATNDTSQRINNLLALTHQQKISVSMKKSAITSF